MNKKHFTLLDSITINLKCSPVHTVHIIIQSLVLALISTFQVVVISSFVDKVSEMLRSHKPISHIFDIAILMLILVGYQWIGRELINLSKIHLEVDLLKYCNHTLVNKISKLKYHYIENQATLERVDRITKNAETEISQGFEHLLSLVSLIISFVGILVLLIFWAWWATIIILLVSIPLFLIGLKSGKATYQANMDVTGYKRRFDYLNNVLTNRENAEERTLFSYTDDLDAKYNDQYQKALKIELKNQFKWFVRLKTGSIFIAVITVVIAIILTQPLFQGIITFGIYVSLVTGCFNLVDLMSWQLSRSIDGLAKCNEFFKDISTLYNMEEEEGAQALAARNQKFESLVFHQVRFKYPNTDRYILDGFSMTMKQGHSYGFVGLNGAGKTTFTKLLTGLYREYEGSILLNNKELKEYSLEDLKGMFSAVYQDFARYYIPLKENIRLGDILTNDENLLMEVSNQSGLTELINNLKDKWDTHLGKINESGVDISGGEWQRVAIARALINPAPVCILDEPTAALDPIAESHVYEEFEQLSHGRTTIFISHRLGSMKLVDYIFVIHDGMISEQGTHDELMKLGGSYHAMYNSQKRWYE